MLYSSDQRPEMTLMEQGSKNQKSWLLMGTLAASTPALFLLLKAVDLAVAASLSSWVQLRPCTGKEEGATVVASHAPCSTGTQESEECFLGEGEFGVHISLC